MKKWIKEKIINIWWKYRGLKKSGITQTYDTIRYGRVVTVVRYHDRLLIICENSIWELNDYMGRMETTMICDRV